MTTGICRNGACENARSATPIELYPGPGQYCPACGESLAPSTTPPPPFGGLSALEALAQFSGGEPQLETPAPKPRSPLRKRAALAAVSVAVAAITAAAVFRPTAAQRSTISNAVHVCRSSMTDRVAADMVRAYADKSGVARSRFDLTQNAPCDVRFAAKRTARDADVLGHDGIVVVVNPQNPLTRLSEDDVRLIFSGAITDWAEFGAPPGRIIPIMPAGASDESATLAHTLLAHSGVTSGVRRLASSVDVVRTVVSPAGRGAIGFVAFSAAVPAKVIALAPHAAPSFLSIGDQRYSLSVALTVEAKSRAATAAGLAAFARSNDAQMIVLRDGFVPKQRI